ncbi:MAG: hypothetical protein QOE65_2872 [Solirubrobacteraceae bacterium]|jgi:hypothetical protein|nr:hypothetical protein [Solirubrobacteraceae bacterium]
MFDAAHYVPVLKGRAGEFAALREADERVRSSLTPLIEIPPVPWDFEAERPAKNTGDHVAGIAEALRGAWGIERRLFLDAALLASEDLIEGRHPLAHVVESTRGLGVLVVPVWGLERGTPYLDAVRDAIASDERGACLRLESDDLEEPEDMPERIRGALNAVGLGPSDTDLIVDLGAITAEQRWTGATARLLLSALPTPQDWRSLTLVASSFPLDLSGFQRETIGSTPRAEWQMWRALHARRHRLDRLPTFGDYAISHPAPREVDPRIIQRSASIRYTVDEDFLIAKGRSVRLHGAEQQHDLAATLAERPEYHGESFSAGDRHIAACARRETGPGNAMTWRRVGTSQHLAYVTSQIANLAGP